jgi:DNA-binding response OmpR family regulator
LTIVELNNKYKVLLADDEPQNIKNLFETLNSNVYRIFVAPNGMSAVDLAIKHQPDAIIMDWDMPEMDGIEAIKIIRASDVTKNIPVIVATGRMTTVENLRTALEAGANDYIRKPYDPIEIDARIKSMIRLREEQIKTIRLENKIIRYKLDEANREIELNNQSLAASKIRLIYHSKNNESLIDDLQNLGNIVDVEAKKIVFDIVSAMKANTKSYNWTEFENHFDKVHPVFFSNLQKRFPDLTSNETELCVFIKLNMTTREIMAITFKTDIALKKARQRLKKKLGLNTDDSLYSFIKEIE